MDDVIYSGFDAETALYEGRLASPVDPGMSVSQVEVETIGAYLAYWEKIFGKAANEALKKKEIQDWQELKNQIKHIKSVFSVIQGMGSGVAGVLAILKVVHTYQVDVFSGHPIANLLQMKVDYSIRASHYKMLFSVWLVRQCGYLWATQGYLFRPLHQTPVITRFMRAADDVGSEKDYDFSTDTGVRLVLIPYFGFSPLFDAVQFEELVDNDYFCELGLEVINSAIDDTVRFKKITSMIQNEDLVPWMALALSMKDGVLMYCDYIRINESPQIVQEFDYETIIWPENLLIEPDRIKENSFWLHSIRASEDIDYPVPTLRALELQLADRGMVTSTNAMGQFISAVVEETSPKEVRGRHSRLSSLVDKHW